MALSDELTKLQDLHGRGGLTDEEFARAKARVLNEPVPPTPPPAIAAANAMRRSRTDSWFAGVCGGIARTTGVDSWLIRLLFCILILCGGVGLLVYILLWIFVPME